MGYLHVQRGRFDIIVGAIMAVLLAPVVTSGVSVWWVIVLMAVVVVLAVNALSTLRTLVTNDQVVAMFGWGVPIRKIDAADIVSAEIVRNSWFVGWGIRWIPRGWVWNVWGRNTVELELTNGRRFRIGTDDPHGFSDAIGKLLRATRRDTT